MTNEEKILEMLGTMQEDLTRVNDRLGRLETTQDKMQAAQEQMQAKQDKMQKDLDTVKSTQAQMQAKQDKMEKDLTKVRGILEVEMDLKVRGLFDGHEMINDKLKKLDDIEEKLEEVSVQVDAIRPTVKEHTRELTQMKRMH